MTRERGIERVLEAWLEPGPTEAPDGVADVLADRSGLGPPSDASRGPPKGSMR